MDLLYKDVLMSLERTKQVFKMNLDTSRSLKGRLLNNKFNIKTKKELYLTPITQEIFSIAGKIEEKNGKTSISYKVRGNDMYFIFNIVGIMMSIPTFAIIFWVEQNGKEQKLNVYEHNLTLVMLFLIIDIAWFISFYRMQLNSKRKGEKKFMEFLEKLESPT